MNKTSIWKEMDFEAIQILVITTILSVLMLRYSWSIYAALAIVLLPQGRILVRGLVDRPRDKQPVLPYLLINESVVLVVALLYGACWYWLHHR